MHRIALVMATAAACMAQTLEQPSRSVSDPGIVTTRQAITPAGVPSVFQGRVYGVSWAEGGDLWVLHTTEVSRRVWENKLALVDAGSGEVMRQVETGIAPFAAAIDRKGTTAWVSNLGGRPPKPGELFASPMQKPAEQVVVDNRGVASTGAITRVD